MKLRQKLLLSLLLAVFLPMILGGLGSLAVMQRQLQQVNSTYHTHLSIGGVSGSMTDQFMKEVASDFEQEIRDTAEMCNWKLLDQTYCDELNARMGNKYSYLLVRNQGEITYPGDNEALAAAVKPYLPKYGSKTDHVWVPELGAYLWQYDFGAAGSVFAVIEVEQIEPKMRSCVIQTFCIFVILSVFSAIITTFVIYNSYYRPLLELEEACKRIADGDLNFTITSRKGDDLKELTDSFEVMRAKLKESMEKQVEDDKQNRELISNISHDLKTPITSIKGYVEGLMEGVANTPEKQDLYLHTIYSKANDLNRLIDELTYYSRISTNRIPYTFSKMDMVAYYEDCAVELEMDFEASEIEFHHDSLCKEAVIVVADPIQLRKVINNIIGNAIKYMDKAEQKVEMCLYREGDEVIIRIGDNGKGIAQKDLGHIFERFYRTDSARTSSKGGSGIGLAICKKIMDDHGGRIWAESREGEGTTFYFALKVFKEES